MSDPDVSIQEKNLLRENPSRKNSSTTKCLNDRSMMIDNSGIDANAKHDGSDHIGRTSPS
jgi:hypothetical protein